MSVAYIDASALTAIAFNEPGSDDVARRLDGFPTWISSNLLEAEFRAACVREQRVFDPAILENVDWVLPARPLTPELAVVAGVGYLRGADLWHVATALYATEDSGPITFITLDQRQGEVAAALGFQT